MDETVAVQSATIRSSMRVSLPDAVVIASGMLAGCEAIVSNDARWKQRGASLFPQCRWIYLSDYSDVAGRRVASGRPEPGVPSCRGDRLGSVRGRRRSIVCR